jgi:hypothetical protein
LKKTLWTLTALTLAALATVAASPPNLTSALEEQIKLVNSQPNDAAAHNDLGNLLVLANRNAEAETAYRRAIEIDAKRSSAHFNLGLLLQRRGEDRAALREFKATVKSDPNHAWAHFQIGMLLERSGRREGAIEAYAKSFALDPQLVFPEVNPNIIDSELVTSSMLLAYRADRSIPLAPNRYDQPGRIANLLVPPIDVPATAAVEGAPNEAVANPAAAGGGGKPEGPTVLTPSTLGSGSGSRAGSTTGRRTGLSGTGRAGTRPDASVRNWTRPDPDPVYEDTVNEEDPGEYIEEEPPPPPPGGIYYQPGLASTGRLTPRLVPGRSLDSRAAQSHGTPTRRIS